MKIKKVNINQDFPTLNLNSVSGKFAHDLFYPQETNKLSINLIEIETQENPSDLIFVIDNHQEQKVLPLYLFKTKLILIKDKFCWDVQDNEDFVFNSKNFIIRIEGELKEFSIDFYYTTDQKNPFTIYNENDYRNSRFR